MSVLRWVRDHPFLSLGVGSFLFLTALTLLEPPRDSATFGILVLLWRTAGFGPHLAANLLARLVPDLASWLDGTLVVLLGLLPYLIADLLLARLRRRRPKAG